MSTKHERQCAGAVLMVRPAAFAANPQTAASNAFQQPQPGTPEHVQTAALNAFDAARDALRGAGVDVHVLSDCARPQTPDAVFPNNWLTTHADGRCAWYPMAAQNRRWERRPRAVTTLLQAAGYGVSATLDFSALERRGAYVEGTGVLVLDRRNRRAYVARSVRADPDACREVCAALGYQLVLFDALDCHGQPIYHSNVMMSVGRHFAAICTATLVDSAERARVLACLHNDGKTVIDLSVAEMAGFAGNILELRGANARPVIALSQQARESLSRANRERLATFGALVSADLEAIETLAGGSFRCMLAEIFLPSRPAP